MDRTCSQNEEGRDISKTLTTKPTGNRLAGIPSNRWEDNFRLYLKGIGVNGRNLIDSDQNMDYWRVLVNVTLQFRDSLVMEIDSYFID